MSYDLQHRLVWHERKLYVDVRYFSTPIQLTRTWMNSHAMQMVRTCHPSFERFVENGIQFLDKFVIVNTTVTPRELPIHTIIQRVIPSLQFFIIGHDSWVVRKVILNFGLDRVHINRGHGSCVSGLLTE